MNKKLEYTPPTLKVVEFKTERGFAASNAMRIAEDQQLFISEDNSNQNEQFGSEHWSW